VEPFWRDELVARQFCLEGLTHGPWSVLDAVATPRELRADGARTSLDVVVGKCLARAGRLNEALTLLMTPMNGSVHQAETACPQPWSPFGYHALALVGLGRLSQAEDLLAAAQAELMSNPGSLESAIVASALGALRLEQGRVQSAFMQATSAAATFLDQGLPVAARSCYALSAYSLALAGVSGKATETLAELDGLGLPTDMEYEVAVMQARAWTLAATGDMGTARQNLEVAVELGRQVGDLLGASRALHGLARMGRARQVVDQLSEMASRVDGPMTEARLSYTRAAAA
jgi:hypothetical protein